MAAQPKVRRRLKGAGTVFDWRGTGLLPPNGGRIRPLVMVEHIPVVRNVEGISDFITLANVLRAQGLSLQAATDREGNVALYNRLDALCFQARGANMVSCGVEHMHMTTSEPWTKRQLRASAWLWVLAERWEGIPLRGGSLGSGAPGIATVRAKGHVTHKRVSAAAGFNDRSDPGPGYDFEYVKHCARYWKRRRTFEGA